ncbi:replication terminator protein [Bacillus sp. AFS002410]|uniref:replication terminator protein n=1 Tax=Bacillus sp. AFS002410 TaxID=2033481 RepID=UPI000BF0CE17|nr:replication terminator protein [Bacillus sp. AFS002410]PEJ46938.1 replication terminator protein [Bacillus sp. AFS002410]
MSQIIDLQSFADGAVAERFNQELLKVLGNIADPNTDAKKARKLTITVTLKADEQRDIAQVSIEAKTTLAAAKPVETKIVMDYDGNGQVTGAELKSGVKGQMFVDDNGEILDDVGNKIVSFK